MDTENRDNRAMKRKTKKEGRIPKESDNHKGRKVFNKGINGDSQES